MVRVGLEERLNVLGELIDESKGRVPGELTERSEHVYSRASQRLVMGPQTVVALAGATGSGKSSLFNALAGIQLAEVGVRRPTTSETLAVSFGTSNIPLLDWLGITRRNEAEPGDGGHENLVLLDLPDHDSTEVTHRQEVDRLVRVVDQFVWVVDPQKYADAAIHERYLRPLAAHRDVITVVLNHADVLEAGELNACLTDLRRLLDEDGLAGVPLLATSARTGQGVDELRGQLAKLAAHKTAAVARLRADVEVLAGEFDEATGGGRARTPSRETVTALNASLEQSAGVPLVVDAVHQSMVQRGRLATGWPLTKWLARLKPDPLRRFRIGGAPRHAEIAAAPERSSLPMRGSVTEARLRTGLRTLSTQLGEGMPPPWQNAVHDAVHVNVDTLPDSLDAAIVTADLGTDDTPVWWQLLRVLQWLLVLAVIAGVVWLTANAVLAYFGLPRMSGMPVRFPNGLAVPLPTLLVGGGLVAGIVVSLLSRAFVGLGARTAARRARRVLHRQVVDVGRREVLDPAQAELDRYARVRGLVDQLQTR